MGRPRIVRKAEEAAAIPPEQPIQVEIPPEGTVELANGGDTAAQKKDGVIVAQQQEPDRRDEELTTLKSQLEQMKKDADEQRRLAQQAAEQAAAVRRQFDDRNKEYESVSTARDQAELDAVTNAMAAAQAESETAEQMLQQAYANQDWASVTKAQTVLTRANTRLVQLEDAKVNLETKAERAKEAAKAQPQIQPTGDPVEAHINAMPGLNQAQRDWLKSHRELMTDGRKNVRLQNAHIDADEKGLRAGSDEYFQFIEERLGYRKPQQKQEDTVADDDDSRAAIVAAPVSRETPSAATGRPTPTRITLTAEQREAARSAGVDEVTYAKHLLKLQEMKKQGMYGTEH